MTNKSIILFWILIVFHLDPGGFLRSYLEPIQRTIYYFISFGLITIIFIYNFGIHKFNVFKLKFIKIYLWVLFLWYLYYFLIFFGVNNKFYESFIHSLVDNFELVYTSLLVIPIVYFSFFGLKMFLKILFWSTIIIGMLFLITVFTGIELINTWSAIRGETAGLTRHFLYGYGLMFFIIPLTFTIIFLKVRLDKRVLLSFIVMILVIMVTIYRREMVATVEYVIICAFLVAFVQNKSSFLSFSKYLNAKTILVAFSIFILLLIFSEDFLQNSLDLIHNSLVNLGLIQDGNSRIRDVRLSLTGKTGIVKAISNYFITGTGFNPIWYTGDGGENQWEGADYVFLAALAMYGIMGLLSFLPFYILVYNVGYKFVKFSKINYKLIIKSEKNLIFLIIGVACISEFVRNLIEYPNWFYPIGAIMDRGKFYIYFGLILSSYYNLKNQFS